MKLRRILSKNEAFELLLKMKKCAAFASTSFGTLEFVESLFCFSSLFFFFIFIVFRVIYIYIGKLGLSVRGSQNIM